ncbi:MAG TPA: hypothetical protein VGP18_09785 [Solirubrobacteraceae bacterium]|nr:hypothetical protein [Solirubrobacteraceae bacterium]
MGELAFQSITQIAHASNEPVQQAEIAFAKTVKRLRWSNPKLDYYIHGSAEETRANAEIVMPDVCSEAQAIVANDYQTVPESMARFERQENAANSKVSIVIRPHEKESSDLQQRILHMLEPYELPSEKGLLPRQPTSQQREEALKFFFGLADELTHALGFPER